MDKAPRRDKGQPRWTKRDIWVMLWIAEMYAVRFDQLLELLSRQPLGKTQEEGWVASPTVRHWIERWRKAGLVGFAPVLVGHPGWVWVTRKGLQTLDLDYRVWEPNPARLRHLYYCNEARLQVEREHLARAWYSERLLWRGREEGGHRVDAELLLANGQSAGVEVELTAKLETRLHGIFRKLGQDYTEVWYFTLPKVTQHVRGALENWGPYMEVYQRKFRFIELEDNWEMHQPQ